MVQPMIPVGFCIHDFSKKSPIFTSKKEGLKFMKTKKLMGLRWILMAAAVLLLLGGLVKLCNYLLVDDSESYTRLTMHELYERQTQERR